MASDAFFRKRIILLNKVDLADPAQTTFFMLVMLLYSCYIMCLISFDRVSFSVIENLNVLSMFISSDRVLVSFLSNLKSSFHCLLHLIVFYSPSCQI